MKFNKLFLLSVLVISLFIACNNDDDNILQNNDTLFTEMQDALGGADNIANATAISYQSTGVALEFQEDPEPVDGKVADYTFNLLYNLDGTQSKQAWDVDAEYAYATHFEFVETIDGTKGLSEGSTGTFPERFAGFGVTGDPMFSTKLAARQKTLMMSSPLAIAKLISTADVRGTDYGTIPIGFNTSSLGFGASTPDIELIINTNTKLPTKAQVLENDPLLGDVVYEVVYSNWSDVNGLQLPQKLEHILNGFTIRTETLSNIEVNPSFDDSELTVATPNWNYDATQAMYGHLSSQFHYRTILQTFPIDFPVEFTEQTSPLALPSELVATDPNAYRISGDFQSHYTYAFKVDGGLLIYDSPVNDRRSAAVLNRIRSDFRTAPIRYVVNSHNHFDHNGGTRGNLAEGGDLIVGSGSKTFMEDVLQRPSTVLPNPIEGNSINVIGVEENMTIGTGEEQIELYTIPSHHSEDEDYIVLYKPFTKTIYFNDLVNPGFVFVFDQFPPIDQERIIHLAKDIVDFVDGQGIDVQMYHCTHGFTTQDFDFQTIRDLADM
ncbi:MAG: MBL fold metallo-hydrolase [Saprospiraceae bacterium]|jgi:glyoxylase-like metal-dependent hydrolase (beta-lactamase superfamily II)|nr:MBL fold metallo-hydrolase [Saprospiraceae bacterium]